MRPRPLFPREKAGKWKFGRRRGGATAQGEAEFRRSGELWGGSRHLGVAYQGEGELTFPPDIHLRGVRVRSRGVGKEAELLAGPW